MNTQRADRDARKDEVLLSDRCPNATCCLLRFWLWFWDVFRRPGLRSSTFWHVTPLLLACGNPAIGPLYTAAVIMTNVRFLVAFLGHLCNEVIAFNAYN